MPPSPAISDATPLVEVNRHRDDSPSSPLSELSRSPSIPTSPTNALNAAQRYPSPSTSSLSSTTSGTTTPSKTAMSDSVRANIDPASGDLVERPRKRRKVTPAPKERSTEYLDLFHTKKIGAFDGENECKLDRLVHAIRRRKKIVVIAGAGISVSAGIPDFRSKQGLFATLPNQHKMKGSGKDLFDASVYKHDSSTEKFHKMVCDMHAMTRSARPTPFHHMLASLAAEGRLLRLYTQNVDCLESKMPPLATNVPLNTKGPWPKTIQLHGSIGHMNCSKCSEITPLNSELFVNHEAPLCAQCLELDMVRTAHAGKRSHGVGRLRPRMVLYNEFNPDGEAIGKVSSADLKKVPDAVIVVGTSLQIPGVRRLVKELTQATRSKRTGFTAWINLDQEPQHNDFKGCWDLVVKGKADDVAHFVQLPHWDEQKEEAGAVLSEEDDKLRKQWLRRDTVEIRLSQPSSGLGIDFSDEPSIESHVDRVQGIPTPSASPRIPPALPDRKTGKTKQSKLTFGRTLLPNASDSETTTKPTTKRKRAPAKKRSRVVKNMSEPPKNAVTQVFKTVKNQTGISAKANKVKKDPCGSEPASEKDIELPSLRPKRHLQRVSPPTSVRDAPSSELSDAPLSSPSLQLSSESHKSRTSAGVLTPPRTKLPSSPRRSPFQAGTIKGTAAIARPVPQPASSSYPAVPCGDTISPTSKPRGMEALVD